jgi:hypothetical protein
MLLDKIATAPTREQAYPCKETSCSRNNAFNVYAEKVGWTKALQKFVYKPT